MSRPMALPSKVNFVTFDVYGTLIDWETGICRRLPAGGRARRLHDRGRRRGHPPLPRVPARDPERLLRALRRGPAPRGGADRQGHRLAAGALARRLPAGLRRSAGRRSRRPTRSSKKFAKKFQTGLISNIDDKLLGQTRRHLPTDFDLVVTAQQVRSYKPDPAHFKECARRIGTQEGLGPRRVELLPRRRAVPEGEGPGHLGQPQQGGRSSPARRSRRPRSRPSPRRRSCSARRRARGMRVVQPARGRRRLPRR